MAKTKSHTIYKVGKIVVPGVTTIGNQLDKPALTPAAVKLERQGIDYKKHWNNLAEIGTLAHLMTTNYLTGKETDFSDNDPKQISQAENAFLSYLEWEKRHEIKVVFVENPLVHDVLMYGGTEDIYCYLDGKLTLIDLKTGKGIWDEAYYQMAGLRELMKHNAHEVEEFRILNIPRTEDEAFDDKLCSVGTLDESWKVFQHLLAIYHIKHRKE